VLIGMKLHGGHIDKIKGEISDKMMPGTTMELPPIAINCKNQKKAGPAARTAVIQVTPNSTSCPVMDTRQYDLSSLEPLSPILNLVLSV
jgi:hypothetical protein